MVQRDVVDRLLEQWRAEIDSVPMPAGLTVKQAAAIVAHARSGAGAR